MFISVTRSTIAVTSNSGCSRDGGAMGRPSIADPAWDARLLPTMALHSLPLEQIEQPDHARRQRILQPADADVDAGQEEVERNGRGQAHRRANQGDADFGGDLRR